MKRVGVMVVAVALSFVMAGCGGGGLEEGAPTGPVTAESAQSDTFKEQMRQNAGNMNVMKKQNRPKPSPTDTKKEPTDTKKE